MSNAEPIPTEINLHRKQHILEVTFDNGARFELPCEYLRVFSPSADAKAARARGEIITGKADVNIEQVAPVGHYAVQLIFSDGHDTGVYYWRTLYDLGQDFAANWARYQEHYKALEQERAQRIPEIQILYFATLVDDLGRERETFALASWIHTLGDLMAILRTRGGPWVEALVDDRVTITRNRQFATSADRLYPGDEVSFTPIYKSSRAEA